MENNQLRIILQKIHPDNIIKLIVSNKKSSDCKYNKIIITPYKNEEKQKFKVESFTDKQAFQSQIALPGLNVFLEKELSENFKQLDGILTDKTISLKVSKREKILFNEKKTVNKKKSVAFSHDREKNYILQKGTYVPALFELGVISKDGKVLNSGYDKFKQINRFVEIIDDSVKNIKKDSINVIDFGCGKSYLTFVLYYYLTEIKKIKANIIGLDLKKDVIDKCNDTAKKYGYSDLHFFCGDIKDYQADFVPDIVITLHACDTATDYALYNSVIWNAKYIFSVPCCQHEVNNTIKADTLCALTDYGIIKERMSALITDTLRSKLLECCSYTVDLMEFIDIAHSPKNLLIRAEKTNISAKKKKDSFKKIEEIRKEFSFDQTLYNLLKDRIHDTEA